MKNLKIRLGLFSLLTMFGISVLITSCQQEELIDNEVIEIEQQPSAADHAPNTLTELENATIVEEESQVNFRSCSTSHRAIRYHSYCADTLNNPQCTAYVSCRDQNLMAGWYCCDGIKVWTELATIQGKQNLINAYSPCVGCAVVIKLPVNDPDHQWGHVAYIEQIAPYSYHGAWWFEISEANHGGNEFSTRWMSTSDPSIVGYQNPNYIHNCSY